MAVVANNLRVDAATGEALTALEEAGIQAVLLKGPAVARWLYTSESPRFYGDCDLLVARETLDSASEKLCQVGFEPRHDDPSTPDWGREHAREFERRLDGTVVDLHTTLPGVGVDAETAWSELRPRTETMAVGGVTARVLDLPGRALHVALHSAQHGIDWQRPLQDLERAISTADDATWSQAADLASRLAATEGFAAGLRLTAEGQELAARLGLPPGRSVEAALRAKTPPPVALGFEQMRNAGWAARCRLVAQKLFPPPAFMRRWRPIASRGRTGLALAYAYRPIWLIRRAPAGYRAWREARRSVRGW